MGGIFFAKYTIYRTILKMSSNTRHVVFGEIFKIIIFYNFQLSEILMKNYDLFKYLFGTVEYATTM